MKWLTSLYVALNLGIVITQFHIRINSWINSRIRGTLISRAKLIEAPTQKDRPAKPSQYPEWDKAGTIWTRSRMEPGGYNPEQILNGTRRLKPRQDPEWDQVVITNLK